MIPDHTPEWIVYPSNVDKISSNIIILNGDGSIGEIHFLEWVVGEIRQIAMNRTKGL